MLCVLRLFPSRLSLTQLPINAGCRFEIMSLFSNTISLQAPDVEVQNTQADGISAIKWSPTADFLAVASWDNSCVFFGWIIKLGVDYRPAHVGHRGRGERVPGASAEVTLLETGSGSLRLEQGAQIPGKPNTSTKDQFWMSSGARMGPKSSLQERTTQLASSTFRPARRPRLPSIRPQSGI